MLSSNEAQTLCWVALYAWHMKDASCEITFLYLSDELLFDKLRHTDIVALL